MLRLWPWSLPLRWFCVCWDRPVPAQDSHSAGRLGKLLCPPNRAKRDQDNFAGKTLLDALTKAGLWGDDSQIKRTVIEWADVVKGGAVLIQVQQHSGSVAA